MRWCSSDHTESPRRAERGRGPLRSPSSGFTICSFSGRYERLLKDMPEKPVSSERRECVPRDMMLSVGVSDPLRSSPFSASSRSLRSCSSSKNLLSDR